MKDISYFQKVNNLIDQLFYEGTINEGTLQVLSDILDGLGESENDTKEEFISDLKEVYQIDSSLDSLHKYLNREFKAWEGEHEDAEEILKDRFNIGESMQYFNVKEFLKDLNYEIMQGVLNGSITSGFKQAIPKELFEFLPLVSFEEQVEESITNYYDDPEEYKKKGFQKKEFPNFHDKIIDIFIYIKETLGTDYISEIAFDQGYSLPEVKQQLCEIYQNRFTYKNEKTETVTLKFYTEFEEQIKSKNLNYEKNIAFPGSGIGPSISVQFPCTEEESIEISSSADKIMYGKKLQSLKINDFLKEYGFDTSFLATIEGLEKRAIPLRGKEL